MTETTTAIYSDLAIPPGEHLTEELEARGMTQKELAARMGRPVQAINEIVRGRKAITADTAFELERVLGIGADFWTNLENRYRITLRRNQEREELLEADARLLEYAPLAELRERGYVTQEKDNVATLRSLLGFFGVATLEALTSYEGYPADLEGDLRGWWSLRVWLRAGIVEADRIKTAPYSQQNFRSALARISEQARSGTDEPTEIQRLCAEGGVAFVQVEPFGQSHPTAAVRWLTPDKALLQMPPPSDSLYRDKAAIRWLDFIHAAHHVLLQRKRAMFVDGVGAEDVFDEGRADAFAERMLGVGRAATP